MPFDFRALLSEVPDPQLKRDNDEMIWAHIGRRVYQNVMDEKFVKALITAQLGAVTGHPNKPPQQELARMVRAYIFSGTIAR